MSVGAGIWRHIVSKTDTPHREMPALVVNSVNEPAFSLMHQLFFPRGKPKRRSVLLVGADAGSRASGLCEQLAIALSKNSGEMVGIIESGSVAGNEPSPKRPMSTNVVRPAWQAYMTPVSERVRRIPCELLSSGGPNADPKYGGLELLRESFEYFLLAASASDNEIPMLCNLCDAAVLVVTANVTRRESALKAKEELLRQGVNLLGVVLDQRTWPIPESIYHRL